MSISEKDDVTSATTFKEAFGVLQRHADTLRRQQEPNIDELVNIVSESVKAYRICEARIKAVEEALERTLGQAENGNDTSVDTEREVGATSVNSRTAGAHATSSAPDLGSDEISDEDIPF